MLFDISSTSASDRSEFFDTAFVISSCDTEFAISSALAPILSAVSLAIFSAFSGFKAISFAACLISSTDTSTCDCKYPGLNFSFSESCKYFSTLACNSSASTPSTS